MASKDLADRSTMELERVRQVPDGRAQPVSIHESGLFVCVEAVLGLLWGPSGTVAFGLVE